MTEHNPYQPPDAELQTAETEDFEYVGFWARVWASIIDSLLFLIIVSPLLWWIYGPEYFSSDEFIHGTADFILNWVFPAVAVLAFWFYKSATPGKMAINARIVDATSGGKPSRGQLVGRYLGYYVSMLPLFLGIIWVAFDPRKQGFHDKLANTVVVKRIGND